MASELRRARRPAGALDWEAMEALLRDFFVRDLWPIVEAPPAGVDLHVVKATQSSRLSDAACARIEAAVRATGRVELHRVALGHGVPADNRAAIAALLAAALP